MTLRWSLVVPVLAALAAGCGPESATQSQRTQQSVECSLRVPAADLQRTLRQVEDGSLDPCAGALTERASYSAELERVVPLNGEDPYVLIIYQMRVRHPNDPKTYIP